MLPLALRSSGMSGVSSVRGRELQDAQHHPKSQNTSFLRHLDEHVVASLLLEATGSLLLIHHQNAYCNIWMHVLSVHSVGEGDGDNLMLVQDV